MSRMRRVSQLNLGHTSVLFTILFRDSDLHYSPTLPLPFLREFVSHYGLLRRIEEIDFSGPVEVVRPRLQHASSSAVTSPFADLVYDLHQIILFSGARTKSPNTAPFHHEGKGAVVELPHFFVSGLTLKTSTPSCPFLVEVTRDTFTLRRFAAA